MEISAADRGRRKLALEDGRVITLYKKEVKALELAEGEELSPSDYESIREKILAPRAKKRALYLLAKRDYTEYLLRQKLYQSGYDEELTDAAIFYVEQYHYIDDLRYAKAYIRCHGELKSERSLFAELRQKGVAKDIARQALDEEYGQDEESLIKRWIEKKGYEKDAADEKEKRRMYAFLLRRGFSHSDILRYL
jgi:regulatory protein